MPPLDLFYSYSSITLTAVLFILIVLNKEIAFRIGHFVQNRSDTEIKSLTASVQASVLGLLALLLGFTFTIYRLYLDWWNNRLFNRIKRQTRYYTNAPSLTLNCIDRFYHH